MILYLDTSSLVKLYVTEAHSDLVRSWAEEAEILATCRVAYPEMISALNRRFRTGDPAKGDYHSIVKTFGEEWRHFVVIDFDEIAAGHLAELYGLRGYDAVHLSASVRLRSSGGCRNLCGSAEFGFFQRRSAAKKVKGAQPQL